MTSDTSVSAHRRRKRVTAACDFCRRRKLGCDNAQPKCENCVAHGVACSYAQRTKTPRPSNARISHLEEENVKLRDSLARLNSQLHHGDAGSENGLNRENATRERQMRSPTRRRSGSGTHSRDHAQASSQGGSRRPLPSQAQCITVQEGNFHGPSSALFDDETIRNNASRDPPDAVDANKKNQLLAEATRQRQLESVNLHSVNLHAVKLDFDGVDPDIAMNLLSIFWNRQHSGGSVVYRPAFMRDMACGGPYFSKLLLNAMLWIGSKYSPRNDCEAAIGSQEDLNGRVYRRRAEEIIKTSDLGFLFRSDITTIQALLILSDGLFGWCDEKSLSWHYLGIAINMIVDLGLHVGGGHRVSSKSRSAEDIEIHRRVFWSAFVIDKTQSIYQGRPARLRENDSLVPIVFMDEYEELEPFSMLTYSQEGRQQSCPTYSVSTFEQLCKLSVIMDRILCSLYSEKSSTRSREDLLQASAALKDDLKHWRAELPQHLSISSDGARKPTILPHTLSLMSMYNALIILLHRPFVSDGHLQSTPGSSSATEEASSCATSEAFATCATAAAEIDRILRLYVSHFCAKTTPYFVSYATYVSATIHVRIAAQRAVGSDAHRRLQNCLDILAVHQVRCRGPRRAIRILLGLVKKLKVEVNEPRPMALEDEGAQAADMADGTAQNPGSGGQSTSVTIDVSPLDSTLTDIDMDEIMRSFDFSQPVSSTHVDTSTGSHGQLGNTWGEHWQNMDPSLFLDPLFGFEASLPAFDLPSHEI